MTQACDIPDAVHRTVSKAAQMGGAIMVFDGDDKFRLASDSIRSRYLGFRFGLGEDTYTDWFWHCVNSGLSPVNVPGSQTEAYYRQVMLGREAAADHFFIRAYGDGDVFFCMMFRHPDGWNGQIRIDASAIGLPSRAEGAFTGLDMLLRWRDSNNRLRAIADSVQTGMMSVDGAGRLLWSNESAQRALSRGDGMFVVDGYVAAVDTLSQSILRQIIGEFAAGRANIDSMPVALRRDGRPPLLVSVATAIHENEAYIFVAPDVPQADQMQAEVMRAFGLSDAESRVVAGLSAGMTAEMIAAESGRSASTVRTQLKTASEKLKELGFPSGRQAELMRAIVQLATLAGGGSRHC